MSPSSSNRPRAAVCASIRPVFWSDTGGGPPERSWLQNGQKRVHVGVSELQAGQGVVRWLRFQKAPRGREAR